MDIKQKNITGIFVILAVLAGSAYFIKDSVLFYGKSPEQRDEYRLKNPTIYKRIFNLGLDLQGGMRMVLEIDRAALDKDAQKDVLDRAYTVIENRINGLGVAEPSIQKQGQDRLIIELPGLRDETRAKGMIGSTAQLEFKLLREPAELSRAITVIDNTLKGVKSDSTGAADTLSDTSKAKQEKQEEAQQIFGGADSTADTSDTSAAKAQAGVAAGPASFSGLLARMNDEQIGVLEKNKSDVDKILRRPDVRLSLEKAGLGGNQFLWSHELQTAGSQQFRTLYYVKARPELKGDALKGAQATLAQGGIQAGQPIILFQMNTKGAGVFARVTGMNVNKYLAIILDSTVYSAPRILSKIGGGSGQIEGRFTMEEAKDLAIVLRAGALPAPVKIIEQQQVGPSLGKDSIKMGVNAAFIGLIAIFLFIMVYYKLSGVYASIALLLNFFIEMAFLAAFNATLTLPGICGLVLNLGMAVDANVLICERIREELNIGKTVRSAIETGYSRAFLVIFDSNLTTLITAFILLELGTGPIKGFAVTLIAGLIISMFTALYVTHVMYRVITPAAAAKLSI